VTAPQTTAICSVNLLTRMGDECAGGQPARKLTLRYRKQELAMDTFGYGRCAQCNEENFFMDGSKCARCLGLANLPIDEPDNEEESSSAWLDDLAAA